MNAQIVLLKMRDGLRQAATCPTLARSPTLRSSTIKTTLYHPYIPTQFAWFTGRSSEKQQLKRNV